MIAAIRSAARAPFDRRARRELLWCGLGLATGVLATAVIVVSLFPGTANSVVRGVPILILLASISVGTGTAAAIAGWYRRMAERLRGVRIAPSPPHPVERTALGRFRARLRQSGDWRALVYMTLKAPMALLCEYALLWWAGVVNLT